MTGLSVYKMAGHALALSCLSLLDITGGMAHAGETPPAETAIMIDIHATEARLRDHLKALTVDIGERSVQTPGNLKKAAGYIRDFYQEIGLPARLEPYDYHGIRLLPQPPLLSAI